jgi:drug/metabolite transporter (DMT)-like permease
MLLLAATVLGERLGFRRVVAVVTAVTGVMAVTLPGDGGVNAPGLGDALVLASTGCFAAFVVLERRAFPAYGTLPVLAGIGGRGLGGGTFTLHPEFVLLDRVDGVDAREQ